MVPAKHLKSKTMTLDEFFYGYEESRHLYVVLYQTISTIGLTSIRITKSQIAFRLRKAFAWAWIPAKYLQSDTAPLVLSILLPVHDPSPRWKEVVEPYPGRFIHHLELYSVNDIDDQVRAWLTEAWKNAG